MKIEQILADIEADLVEPVSEEQQTKVAENKVDISPEAITKLAAFLNSYSEQDTLVDDIARLAVLQDKIALVKAMQESKA